MTIFDIQKELTPKKLLKQEKFERPLIISPNEFKSFDDLYQVRDQIRDLKLVPVKDDKMYKLYKSYDRLELANGIKKIFKQNYGVIISPNLFPDWLPLDVNQRIVWIQKNRVSNEKALRRILATLHDERCEKFILFERPLGTKTKLVKGSIPYIRHIHLWTKHVTLK